MTVGAVRAMDTPPASAAPATIAFDFYGVGLEVASDAPELLESLRRDFEYFVARRRRARSACACIARRRRGRASRSAGVDARPRTRSPTTTAPLRYADYHRRALAIFDFAHDAGELWSEDADLLYEVAYLMALFARVGERHNHMGIAAVHALGVVLDGRAALVLLPEGGGKSTLALELLRRPRRRPALRRHPLLAGGAALAFPTRIGVRGAPPTSRPSTSASCGDASVRRRR